jgi:opacity protein-like surface antigen
MHYKKFFSAAALAALLSLSNSAFSDSFPVGAEEAEDTSYYVRLQYNGEFFNMMSGKDLKLGSAASPAALFGYSKGDNSSVASGYKPNYKTSFFAGGVAAGYTMEGIRVELEGLYSQLDVDVDGYKKDNTAITADNVKKFGENGLTSGDNTPASNHYIGENKGFTTMAAMINAYYDVDLGNEGIPVVPYVGAGIGYAKTTFAGADHYKPAYQAKAGVSYAVTPEIKVYGGYRYFGLYGKEFEKVKLTRTNVADANPKTETKDVTLQQEGMFGVHGIEAGVMFNF